MSKTWDIVNKNLSSMPFFTVGSVAQLLGKKEDQVKQIILRWKKTGKLVRLKRGIYMTQEYYLTQLHHQDFSGLVAMAIQPFAYLSREYVLQKHGVLTESTYLITAVTTKNTQKITNQLGTFDYAHIKPTLFGGYKVKMVGGVPVGEAAPAKALFDYLYLRKDGGLSGLKDYDLAEEMRLNLADWGEADRKEFSDWVKKSKSPKMNDALANLQRNIWS